MDTAERVGQLPTAQLLLNVGQRWRPARGRAGGIFWLAVAWLTLVVLAVIFAEGLPLHRYDLIVTSVRPRLPPLTSLVEPLGTDMLGRSVLSRLVFGARQSLIIGVSATGISLAGGCLLGITAGYLRGLADECVGIVLDTFLSIPALVLLLAIAAIGKRDIATVIFGLAIVGTPTFARLARAHTLALAERDYVAAARVLGATHFRIILRELLPSVVLSLSSFALLFLAYVMVAEGTLSFLGLGIPPPKPSWGGMINDGRAYLETSPYLVFVPAICLVVTVASFTVVGDRLRRRLDLGESHLR